MKKNQILGWILVLVGLLGVPVLAADPLYEKFVTLINDSVLPWTRMIGIIGTIGSVIGLMKARSDQSDNLMSWVKAVGCCVGILMLPEVFNWLLNSGGNTTINFN